MVSSDLAHIRAGHLPRCSQSADVFETETKLPSASDESEHTGFGWSIDTTATFGTRGRPHHLYLLVIADGLDIDAGQSRQFADRDSVRSARSRSCDWGHALTPCSCSHYRMHPQHMTIKE